LPPRKRDIDEITTLKAPPFSDEQQRAFALGVELFNKRRHWHAHEAWEAAWLPMGDGSEDDAEIFLRALIQLASGLHLKRVGRHKGARSQFAKAGAKFAVVPATFMGLDVVGLRIFSEYQLAHFSESFSCFLRRVEAEGGYHSSSPSR
jgi:hypothetical protein